MDSAPPQAHTTTPQTSATVDLPGTKVDITRLTRITHQTLEYLESPKLRIVRKGYDPKLVDMQFQDAARHIRRLLTVLGELAQRVNELESTPPAKLEAKRMTQLLGDEAIRLLESARLAAAERIERAEQERVEIIASARNSADSITRQTRQHKEQSTHEIVTHREQVLNDLAQKRKTLQSEVDRLRSTKDQMLTSLSVCRQQLDDTAASLLATAQTTVQPAYAQRLVTPHAHTQHAHTQHAHAHTTTSRTTSTHNDSQAIATLHSAHSSTHNNTHKSAQPTATLHNSKADVLTQITASDLARMNSSKARVAAAGAQVVHQVTQHLKRMVIEERNELLNNIRRTGKRAIARQIAALQHNDHMQHNDRVSSVHMPILRESFEQFVSDIDASIDDVDMKAATTAITSNLTQLIQIRLQETANSVDTAEELSNKVRAIYNESLAKHVRLAAEKSFAAAWPDVSHTRNKLKHATVSGEPKHTTVNKPTTAGQPATANEQHRSAQHGATQEIEQRNVEQREMENAAVQNSSEKPLTFIQPEPQTSQ